MAAALRGKDLRGHVQDAHEVIQHHRGLPPGHRLTGAEDGLALLVQTALDSPCLQGRGDIALGPGGDGLVVIEAGEGHVLQGFQAGGRHGHGQKFRPADRLVWVKEIASVDIGAHKDALFGQADGGLVGRVALHISVGHLGVRLFDLDGYLGLGRYVARRVHRHIGETILASLVLIGGIDELAGAVLRHSHGPPGGGGGELEGEGVPFAVLRVEPAGDSHIFIGGQVHIPGDGGLVGLGEQI